MDKVKPRGEVVFEQYLSVHSLPWDYEPQIGQKHPDYLVYSTSKVLCEIEDFTGSDYERGVLKEIATGDSPAEAWHPIRYVNNAIRSAAKQLRPGKGVYPCVAVLYNDATMPYEHELFITQAMFGRLKITQLVGPQGAMSEASNGYSPEKRYLTPKANRTISALALLEEIQPNIHILRQAEEELFARLEAEEPASRERKSQPFTAASEVAKKALPYLGRLRAELEIRYGKGFLDETNPRLRIYHNPWAEVRLPLSSFNGKHDENLLYDLQLGQFFRV